jgi:adenine-specific DNA methylase
VRNLYYNDLQGVSLNTLYDQADDRLHHYFNTTDFKTPNKYINMRPFVRKFEIKFVQYRSRLLIHEIEEIIRFHLNNFTEDKRVFNQMNTFLNEALQCYVSYDPEYKGWISRREFKNVYHQAYDRVNHYMFGEIGVFNLRPFLKKSSLDLLVDREKKADEEDTAMDVVDESLEYSLSSILQDDEDDETKMYDNVMATLCKKFTGMRI